VGRNRAVRGQQGEVASDRFVAFKSAEFGFGPPAALGKPGWREWVVNRRPTDHAVGNLSPLGTLLSSHFPVQAEQVARLLTS